jgi:MFS family permease
VKLPEILKVHDFTVLFSGRILSAMAMQAQAVIVGWHVYELSHDPLMLGLIGLCEAIPAIGFAFLAGHVVDSQRPSLIYKMSLFILLLNAFMLEISTLTSLNIDAHQRISLLFVGVFISGMVRSFTGPSVFSLISHVVPRPKLGQAAAMNSWAFQMAAIFGPALGGMLYSTAGSTVAFLFPTALLALSCLAITRFSASARAMKSSFAREAFLKSVWSGIQFTMSQKVLLSTMILDMFSVLFGGAVAVLPMFSDQVLHAGSAGLGWLRAAPSVGSGIVALYLAVNPLKAISGRMLLWVVAGFGLMTALFAVSTHFAMAFLFLAMSGAFDGVSMVIRNTILQLLTPESMRGRVSSLSSIFITSSNEIGAFESGVAARFLGLVPSILFGGTMTLVVVGLTATLSPGLRKTKIQPS